jgi:hypothetical protein
MLSSSLIYCTRAGIEKYTSYLDFKGVLGFTPEVSVGISTLQQTCYYIQLNNFRYFIIRETIREALLYYQNYSYLPWKSILLKGSSAHE